MQDRSQLRRRDTRGPASVGPSRRPTPNAFRAPRTHRKARAARSPPQEASLESAVEPAEQETIKGTAAGEGLHTRERCFAVDPHGLEAHGSRQAPTCWVRTGGRMGRPRTQSSRGPPALASAPRRRAASAGGVSGPVPAQSLGAGRGRSSDVGAAAVKDLKSRHATAAPRRAPRPSDAGAGLAQAPPAPPRAPRAPPPAVTTPTPRPQRAGWRCLSPLCSGLLLEFRRRSADLEVWGSPGSRRS